MGDVVDLKPGRRITYKGYSIAFQELENEKVQFSYIVTLRTARIGIGRNLDDAIGKAREMIDAEERKKKGLK